LKPRLSHLLGGSAAPSPEEDGILLPVWRLLLRESSPQCPLLLCLQRASQQQSFEAPPPQRSPCSPCWPPGPGGGGARRLRLHLPAGGGARRLRLHLPAGPLAVEEPGGWKPSPLTPCCSRFSLKCLISSSVVLKGQLSEPGLQYGGYAERRAFCVTFCGTFSP